jgi:O-acetylhomoserine/O-acetylserine sulfhydrylase-like pyridoxal-dependent enzyme
MAREISIPGDAEQTTEDAPTALSMEERLAALEAENARLKSVAGIAAAAVIVPVTPHGDEALKASPYRSMTVAELQDKIDAGKIKEPFISALCADGYYCRRPKFAD